MSAPLGQLIRPASELTKAAVHDALALVVSDIWAAVGGVDESPHGELTGELESFHPFRLASVIVAAHNLNGAKLKQPPWLHRQPQKFGDVRSVAFLLVLQVYLRYGDEDLAWETLIFVGLAFVNNELKVMPADVWESELLCWVPSEVRKLPPCWVFHPAITSVIAGKDIAGHLWYGCPDYKFGVLTNWYNDLDKRRRPWLQPGAPVAPAADAPKTEDGTPAPALPPPTYLSGEVGFVCAATKQEDTASWPYHVPAVPGAPRLPSPPPYIKEEEEEEKVDVDLDREVHIKKEEEDW